jgi:cation diffusion facilitator CzcD-associated flavoprotein CzcO
VSSAAASAAAGRRAAARGRRRPTSASSRRAATSAAPGTGTAIPARSATSRAYSTCRCWKSSATCRSEKYSRAPEILEHSRASAALRLYDDACFQTEVTELRWDEACALDRQTNRGDAIKARFVVMANGPLHRPKLPGIPGIETFKGHSFHTSRWDYATPAATPTAA